MAEPVFQPYQPLFQPVKTKFLLLICRKGASIVLQDSTMIDCTICAGYFHAYYFWAFALTYYIRKSIVFHRYRINIFSWRTTCAYLQQLPPASTICGRMGDVSHALLSNLIPNIILSLRTVTKHSAISRATFPAARPLDIADLPANIAHARTALTTEVSLASAYWLLAKNVSRNALWYTH